MIEQSEINRTVAAWLRSVADKIEVGAIRTITITWQGGASIQTDSTFSPFLKDIGPIDPASVPQ